MDIRHSELWNKFLYGSSSDALEAASALYKLGEMSESVFKTVFFAVCYSIKQEKATRRKGGKSQ